MASVSVYNMQGSQVGTAELSDDVFGVEVNENLLHLAVTAQLANKRQGTQKAKTRSEVRGGGRKPWKQKGTGHARQGSIRAPQWKGGGVVFAPRPRDYTVRLNRKEKKAALKSALTSRVQDGRLVVLDSLKLDQIRTKDFVAVLNALKSAGVVESEKRAKINHADKDAPREYKDTGVIKALVVLEDMDQNVIRSAANVQGIKTVQVNELNTYDILKYGTLIASQAAVKKIEEVYA